MGKLIQFNQLERTAQVEEEVKVAVNDHYIAKPTKQQKKSSREQAMKDLQRGYMELLPAYYTSLENEGK
ncbi:hypothetical protein ACI2JA_03800 [Alkalihalobacillus sp. NPDC078783]